MCSISHPQPLHSTHYLQHFTTTTPPASPFYTLFTAVDTPRLCILHIIYSHSHHQPFHSTHYLQDLTHPASALYTLFLSILQTQPLYVYTLCAAFPTPSLCILHIICNISHPPSPQPLHSTHYWQHLTPPGSAFYTLFTAIHTTSPSILHIICRI